MAKVQVNNVVVLDNPSPFYNPFQFEITFECIEDLSEDLEWKIIYVGSAESEEYDQVLDSVLVGPVPAGRHMFVFQLQRNILASNPRVTRFHINWEDNTEKLEDAESSNPNLQSLLSTDALTFSIKGVVNIRKFIKCYVRISYGLHVTNHHRFGTVHVLNCKNNQNYFPQIP
uniref:Anti-silencing function 1A histone chaperone n=1 Tax=Anas platyrhynchos TaxID=8839 RepID=A0A8B9ZHT3_ANAPL